MYFIPYTGIHVCTIIYTNFRKMASMHVVCYKGTLLCMYVHMYVCMGVCMYVCTHMYVCIHKYLFIKIMYMHHTKKNTLYSSINFIKCLISSFIQCIKQGVYSHYNVSQNFLKDKNIDGETKLSIKGMGS